MRIRATSPAGQTNNIGVTLQIVNDGGTPLSLKEFEVRCWFVPGTLAPKVTQQVDIDYAAVGSKNITAEISSPDQRGFASLRLRFNDLAGAIKPYASSGDMAVRLHKSDWSNYDHAGNVSVTLYRAGALIWGTEP
jgi:hypothetical protein